MSPGFNGSSRSTFPTPACPTSWRGSAERRRAWRSASAHCRFGTLQARVNDKWSIQENVGHLCDLEPLWIRRAEQVLGGETELAVADLTNRPTDEAHHNDAPLDHIMKHFRALRARFVSILEGAAGPALERTARHPRLGTPMRLIDIALFTAEHDDHHLARITELMKLAAASR